MREDTQWSAAGLSCCHIVVNVSQGSAALNREQKLALIVGFSLVLLVGILLTDHLSKARTIRMDGIAELEGSLPLASTTRRSAYAQPPRPGIAEVNIDRPVAEGLSGQVVAHDADPLGVDSLMTDPLTGTQTVVDAVQPPAHDASREQLTSAIDAALAEARSSVLTQTLAQSPTQGPVQTLVHPPVQVAEASASPAIVDPLSTVPDPAWYTVKPNESLWVISERFYGKGTAWRKLAAHNVGRVGENGSIRVGVRLQIPHPSVVLGPGATFANVPGQDSFGETKPTSKPKAKPVAEPRVTATTAIASVVETRSYTIKPNDCLSKIAQKELGTIKRQGEILALNQGRLTDADDIRAGMVIQLPTS